MWGRNKRSGRGLYLLEGRVKGHGQGRQSSAVPSVASP